MADVGYAVPSLQMPKSVASLSSNVPVSAVALGSNQQWMYHLVQTARRSQLVDVVLRLRLVQW